MHDDDRQTGRIMNRREALALLGTAGATMLAGRTVWAAAAEPALSCVASPEQTEGPYFVDERLNRSDIRSDPADGSVREGLPLTLKLVISSVAGGKCAPLAGATPRALKAFGNAYRLARANFTGHRAALALMLAAERGCTAQERAALYEALHAEASQPLSVSDARLEPYVAAAQAAAKGALNVGEARVAQVAAAKFSYGA